jgi:hypothetical protein
LVSLVVRPSKHIAVIPAWNVTLVDALGTIDVDRDAYNNCEATYVPSPDLVEAWFKCNPAIYTILKDTDADRVVGYMNAMPVADSVIDDVMAGDFDERDIGPGTLLRYDQPHFYRLYICSAALLSSYRSGIAFRQLLNGFLTRLLDLAERERYIRDAVVDAVTPIGVKFCEMLGMRFVTNSTRASDIYHVQIYPPRFRPVTGVAAKLHKFYDNIHF